MTGPEIEAFLDIYDDLAVDIVDEDVKNVAAALDYTNQELAEYICRIMDWEDFDLLGHFDFEAVHEEGNVEHILAHGFVSFLRWRLFSAALQHGIGDSEFNQSCAAYSEYWYIELVRHWNALTNGAKMAGWVN